MLTIKKNSYSFGEGAVVPSDSLCPPTPVNKPLPLRGRTHDAGFRGEVEMSDSIFRF